ncbi:lambda-exonuclease family protein [Halomonas sp. OfavH-34-E]|uniref:YqaJ viral recombinase family nuclease n=1 Tax=Halomonas sp. OfavH-34-E TaxID=2954491 RepID=UPI002096A089|nr:YqaJ viral recombinase family protein [Halomonas sp. OfavH-34-E]MCO7216842.1 YqaJ viral recombinase family protein [Halomonas sp. OfavH-34-E]
MSMTIEQAKHELTTNHRVATLGMPEDVWLELRGIGIGASEAAAAVGASEHRTPFEIAERKLGLADDDADANYRRRQKMAMGHVMEPVTAARFAEFTGLNVQNFNCMLAHPEHPFMLANIDRRIVGVTDAQSAWLELTMGQTVKGPGVAELKNVEFPSGWGKPDNVHTTGGLCTSGEVPEDYYIQVQHQLAVTGYEWAFLVVTIAGWETRWYPIVRDDELIDDLIALEGDLWAAIQRGELPEIDVEHPKAIDLLKRRYPGTDGSMVDLSALEHWRKVEQQAKEEIKALETTAKVARAHILEAMGDAAVATFGDDQVMRRKVTKRKAYTVEVGESEYVDTRYGKMNKAEKDQLAAQADEAEQQGEAA